MNAFMEISSKSQKAPSLPCMTFALMIIPAGFDVNFMDDVGQTLLNWAAAFGTYEMVGTHTHIHTYIHTFKHI